MHYSSLLYIEGYKTNQIKKTFVNLSLLNKVTVNSGTFWHFLSQHIPKSKVATYTFFFSNFSLSSMASSDSRCLEEQTIES